MDSREKVLFFADAGSIHIAKWVDYFVESGFEVNLATFSKINKTKCTNITYLSHKEASQKGKNYHYLKSLIFIAKLISTIKPKFIVSHYCYSYGFLSVIGSKLARSSSRLSIVCHGSDILCPPVPFITNILNKISLKLSHKIYAVSDQLRDRILQYNICPTKVFVGQYGLENDHENDEVSKDIDIISIRADVPNSQLDMLLEGLKGFSDKKITFVIPQISADRYLYLKSKYRFVHFHKEMNHKSLMQLIRRSNIYISGTLSDGTSLSLLEGMKNGCIPFVSNIISNRSWVLDTANGYLFSNVIEFEEKLKVALSLTADERKNMKEINKKLIRERAMYCSQMGKFVDFMKN